MPKKPKKKQTILVGPKDKTCHNEYETGLDRLGGIQLTPPGKTGREPMNSDIMPSRWLVVSGIFVVAATLGVVIQVSDVRENFAQAFSVLCIVIGAIGAFAFFTRWIEDFYRIHPANRLVISLRSIQLAVAGDWETDAEDRGEKEKNHQNDPKEVAPAAP